MIVTKGLILKLLGCAGTAGIIAPAIYFRKDLIDLVFSLEESEILDRLGINCTNTSCTLKDGKKLIVLHEGEEKITISSAWATGNGKLLKLKGEKDGDSGSYRYGLKFLIEGGDISLDGGKKLEEFETYEIVRESFSRNSSLFLSRKNKSNVEKEKKLGLPNGCNLPSDQSESTCSNLNSRDLHRMNFSWKNANAPEIEGAGTIENMKIKKVIDADEKTIFENGYKFTLENNPKITFHKQGGEQEVVEANTNIEFTIFKLSNELKLKKAWTLEKLAKKAGFQSCTSNENSSNETCDFGNTINVFFDNTNYTENASVKTADRSKKMTVTKAAGYNQGFKFTTSTDIELENGTPSAAGKKIEANSSYEVKEKEIGNSKKWFLVKK